MEVAKLSALPNLEVRPVSCDESAIKRWLSSELEETVFSLTHELFMTKHHTVTLTTLTSKSGGAESFATSISLEKLDCSVSSSCPYFRRQFSVILAASLSEDKEFGRIWTIPCADSAE